MLPRLDDIEDDLLARRARAEHEAWLGEVKGIDLTLTFLRQKRQETKRLAVSRQSTLACSASSPHQRPGENEDVYRLQAVIAAEHVLRDLVGAVEDVHIVPLGQRLSLLPMTDALFDAVTVAGTPQLDGFWKAPAGFGRVLAACSASGPVAYVEAEYFSGTGEQSAMVWDARQVVLGYLHMAENASIRDVGAPISRALRRLGVTKGVHQDEFDAVGLGRHRDTEDRLPSTS